MIAVLFLADLGLALLTKVAPQLNAINVMFPVKIGLTLLLVGLVLPGPARRRRPAGRPRHPGDVDRCPARGERAMSEEKTEKATPKKRKENRKEGQVPRTQELGAWSAMLLVGDGAADAARPRDRASSRS